MTDDSGSRPLPRHPFFVWSTTAIFICASLGVPALPGCEDPAVDSPRVRERSRLSVVQERPGEKRIEGIGPIHGFGKSRDTTFIHCLELVLEATGRKLDYDELMGISGIAFRMQFNVDRWDVGNPDPLVGDSCLDLLFSAIGVEYELWVVRRDELAEVAALRRKINESIDRGAPVLAANIMPPEDWGIITGYRPGYQWLCRSYNGGALHDDRPAKGWPTAVILLKSRKTMPPLRKTHAESIAHAVELFEQRSRGSYAHGASAFDFWCQNLRSASDRRYIHANVWTYIGLMDARAAAVRYLRSIAKEFGSHERFILQAADRYDAEVLALREGYRYVPSEQAFRDSVPPAEMRQRQIAVLLKAKELEQQAINALRQAK